jgi:membrane-associated protease RseP (regulator of RpoE activity)
MTSLSTTTRSPDQIDHVLNAVRSRFQIQREYMGEGGQILEFAIEPKSETKQNFLALIEDLRHTGDTAVLRKTDTGQLLMVFRKQVHGKPSVKKPLILFIVTVLFIFGDGMLRLRIPSLFFLQPLNISLVSEFSIASIYTVSLVGIIGIHELGHKVATWKHKMESSWPYFLLGIPGVWPTVGAMISAKEPPVNRDALFDLGFSGPIAGLMTTIAVSIFAVATAHVVPPAEGSGSIDIYTSFLIGSFRSFPANATIGGNLFYMLYFAYSIGFLLTFVNLLPAWQLDGGHLANSALSRRSHSILTYISAIIMVLVGFWPMAFLVIILGSRVPAMQPLDEVSPLSTGRRTMFYLTLLIAASIYAFTILYNPFFGFSQLGL